MTSRVEGSARRFRWAQKAVHFADYVAVLGGYLALLCLALLTLLMLAQITVAALSRVFVSISGDIPVAWEYGAYLMGATFMLGSGLTLRAGRHIRLGLLLDSVPRAGKNLLEFFSAMIATCFAGYLTLSLGSAAVQALRSETTSISSSTPIWIPIAVFGVGAAILTIQFAARILCLLAGLPPERHELQPTGGELTE